MNATSISADMNAPYRLILWEDGRLSLSDTATGQRYYLNAFGIDNARAFAALFRKSRCRDRNIRPSGGRTMSTAQPTGTQSNGTENNCV
jgi:hypothetical protein